MAKKLKTQREQALPKRTKSVAPRIRIIRDTVSQQKYADDLTKIKLPRSVEWADKKVTQGMISKYESGQKIPTPHVLLRMAHYGNTTVEWLLTGKG